MSTIDQQFVEYIVKTLVNNPDKVQITRTIDEKGVLLSLEVDPEAYRWTYISQTHWNASRIHPAYRRPELLIQEGSSTRSMALPGFQRQYLSLL